jgi:hypothetical protein
MVVMLSGFVSVPGAQIYHEVYTPEQTQQKQHDIETLMCKCMCWSQLASYCSAHSRACALSIHSTLWSLQSPSNGQKDWGGTIFTCCRRPNQPRLFTEIVTNAVQVSTQRMIVGMP